MFWLLVHILATRFYLIMQNLSIKARNIENLLHFKISCVYCCSCLVCIAIILCVFAVLCVYSCFHFRWRTTGQKSVFGRSCDRPSRHRVFLVSLCLKANAEMVPKILSCHYMLLMQPSRLIFISNQFHILCTCKLTTATG